MKDPAKTARIIKGILNLVGFILVTSMLGFGTYDFMMSRYCANAHGITTGKNDSWMIEVCKESYWDNRYGGRDGWE